jgi:tetratricopeptide (TPR) repeat protein
MSAEDGASEIQPQAAPGAGGTSLSYIEAKRRKSSPRSRWRDIAGELEAELWPRVQPNFRLRAGDTIFTIGSCFARNIEANLKALGCRVPMLDLRLPAEEFDGQPNAAMNKFHPPAFRQSLEWTAQVFDRDGVVTWEDCEAFAFDLGGGRFIDFEMAPGVAPVSRERFVERRQEVYEVFSSVFSADCMMMTPGLIEAWRDLQSGLYITVAPFRDILGTQARWSFEVLTFQQCLQEMLGAIDVVRARNPGVKVLITTSPVPLARTFTGRDVSVANMHSKSVLRAVCDAVCSEREGVDYFPSYEMAMLSNPALVWKSDRIHVSSGFVAKIVGHMLEHYIEGVEEAVARYHSARAKLAAGANIEAEAEARQALQAKPDHADARLVLGRALAGQKRWAEAEAELRIAVEADAERADTRIRLAGALANLGRAEEAVALVQEAMDLPALTIADIVAADAVLKRVPAEAAVRLGERAVELYPRHVEAHERLTGALLGAGRKPEALEALRRAAALPHPTAVLLVRLASLLAETGERDEAVRYADAALNADPGRKDARALKAELLAVAPA